ncbi:hypothetical protein GCM10010428_11000 [Actinosynnema pretiosum subsp. pretiosum]
MRAGGLREGGPAVFPVAPNARPGGFPSAPDARPGGGQAVFPTPGSASRRRPDGFPAPGSATQQRFGGFPCGPGRLPWRAISRPGMPPRPRNAERATEDFRWPFPHLCPGREARPRCQPVRTLDDTSAASRSPIA